MKDRSLTLAALVLAIAGCVAGQETTGTFLGTIRDPSSAPIPHAKVTASEIGTGRIHTTICDDAGNYT